MDLTKEDADRRSSLPYPKELGAPAFAPIAVELMTQEVIKYRAAGSDICWDQTSTTQASRTKK